MKAYDTLLRLQRWRLDQERRQLAGLYRRQESLTAEAAELGARRRDEGLLADKTAEVAYAYPGFAGQVRQEQGRIGDELVKVNEWIGRKQADVGAAYLALKQIEIVRQRNREAAQRAAAAREQAALDELGLSIYRRKGA